MNKQLTTKMINAGDKVLTLTGWKVVEIVYENMVFVVGQELPLSIRDILAHQHA